MARPATASPLRPRRPSLALAALLVCASASADQPAGAPSPNYRAADRFAPANLRPFLYDDTAVVPHWIGKTDGFWYSYRTSEGTNYYRVNPRLGAREPLFDRDKLANLLSAMVQKPLEPALLPIERLVLDEEATKIRFVLEDFRYEVDERSAPDLRGKFVDSFDGGRRAGRRVLYSALS